MKRGKKLLLLLGILVILTGATFAARLITPDDDSSTTTEAAIKFTVLTIESDMVESLSWTYENETLSFTCSGDTWCYSDDASFPLNESYISSMLSSISSIEASKMIEDIEDYSQYGLDEPECRITIGYGNGYELLIGDTSALDNLRYLSIGDGNVYLVDNSILSAFSYGLYDILQEEAIPDVSSGITSLAINSETQSLFIEYLPDSGLAYSDDYVWFLKDGDTYLTLDTELTEALINEITLLTFNDSCIIYNAGNDELAAYGFDSPMISVSIIYTSENGDAESFSLEFGNYSGSSCYARIGDSRMIYLIDAQISDTLMYTGYSSLQPDDVLLMDWSLVTSTDIMLDNVKYSVHTEEKTETDESGNESTSVIYTLKGSEIDFADIQDALTTLCSTGYADNIIPERSAEISFIFHRNTETFSETELTFYKYDSTSCLVSLNGATTVFVARDDVEAIIDAINTITSAN